jgi:transposase
MPPQRLFRTQISGNASKKAYLTPSQGQSIIAKHEAGVSLTELAAEFRRSKSTIHDTLKRYKLHATTSDLPRSGRPPILSLRQKKIIYRKARAAPKIEYSNLIKEATFVNAEGLPLKPPSRSTLYRTLKRRNLTNHRSKKRLKLEPGPCS